MNYLEKTYVECAAALSGLWNDPTNLNLYQIFLLLLMLLAVFGLSMIASAFIWPEKTPEPEPEKEPEEYGRLKQSGLLEGPKGAFLGYARRFNNVTPPIYYGSDRHILTFGPTGSGKGTTVQIPALLDLSWPQETRQ